MNKSALKLTVLIILVIDSFFALFWYFNPETRVEWFLLEFPIFLTVSFLVLALLSLIPKVNAALNTPSSSNSGCIIALIIVVAAYVGGWALWNQYLQSKFVPFTKYSSEYMSISDHQEVSGGEYITGKILPLNKTTKKVDELVYFNLPGELRPSQPQEAGTILLLEWGREQVGSYTDGGKAYVQTCKLTLIDTSLRAIIGEMSFRGSEPPSSKDSGSGSRSGSKPIQEILDYLKGLPHK